MADVEVTGEETQAPGCWNHECKVCRESEHRLATAIRYCVHCAGWLCEACCEAHRRFPQLQHHHMTEKEDTSRVCYSTCSTHTGLEQKYFCQSCAAPACAECRLESGAHWQHECSSLGPVIEEKLSVLEGKRRCVEDYLQQTEDPLRLLGSVHQQAQEKRREVERKLAEHHELTTHVLHKVHSQLTDALTRTFNAHQGQLQLLMNSQLAAQRALKDLHFELDTTLKTRDVGSVLAADTVNIPEVPETTTPPEVPEWDVDVIYITALTQVLQALQQKLAANTGALVPLKESKKSRHSSLSEGRSDGNSLDTADACSAAGAELVFGPDFAALHLKDPANFSDIRDSEISILKGDWVRSAEAYMSSGKSPSRRLPVLHGPPAADRSDYKVVSENVARFLRKHFGSILDQPLPVLSKQFFKAGPMYIVTHVLVQSANDTPFKTCCSEVRIYHGAYRFPSQHRVFLEDRTEVSGPKNNDSRIRDIFKSYRLKNYDRLYVPLK